MAWVVWFTGLPGCGKTTIAQKTKEILQEMGVEASILQLDEIRRVITPNPRYTEEERDMVYASLAYMAKLLWSHGINVIVDATANRQRYRDLARSLITDFAEVYVQAPLEICQAREIEREARFSPRDIYKKAEQGALVPGVGTPYEAPVKAEIVLDAVRLTPPEAGLAAARRIKELFFPQEMTR